jgi:predicted Zn-dependent protease
MTLLLGLAMAADPIPLPNTCDAYLTDAAKRPLHALDELLRSGLALDIDAERALGDELHLQIVTSEYPGMVDTDRRNTRYVRKVAKRVLKSIDEPRFDYQVHFIDEGTVNAFAIPGGHVYIHRGLMDEWVHNEAQLAVVLGHEIGHIELRHPSALMEYLNNFPLLSGDVGFLVLALSRSLFSSAQELDSDAFGMRAAHLAGYDVSEGVTLWESQIDKPGRADGRQNRLLDLLGELGNIVSSHPDARARACYNTEHHNALNEEVPQRDGYVGERKFNKRRVIGPRW